MVMQVPRRISTVFWRPFQRFQPEQDAVRSHDTAISCATEIMARMPQE